MDCRPRTIAATLSVLRALAEGRIRWAFWPPGTAPETIAARQGGEGAPGAAGIWIAHEYDGQDDSGGESEGEDEDAHETRLRAANSDDDHGTAEDDGEESAEDEDEDVEEPDTPPTVSRPNTVAGYSGVEQSSKTVGGALRKNADGSAVAATVVKRGLKGKKVRRYFWFWFCGIGRECS